jgi:hypothetical protein
LAKSSEEIAKDDSEFGTHALFEIFSLRSKATNVLLNRRLA